MSTIRVAVTGAGGRMGRAAVDAVLTAPGLELVGGYGRDDRLSEVLDRDRPDVAVDFTTPEVVERHLETYLENRVRPVVGTTGLRPEELVRLSALAREHGVGGLIAPNFAIGAVLMMEFARAAAAHLERCEIVEYHHPAKLDAPSGTALETRARLAADHPDRDEIPIHSVRLPGHLAHQEVIFGGSGERLSIRHDTMDRGCFMPGVIVGIRGVMEIEELVVGLEHFLK